MLVIMNTGGIAATNCFLVADEESKEAVLFDAPNDTTAPLLDEAVKRKLKLKGLWLTHGHFDHVADHKVVTDRFPDARVLIHALDEPKLERPGAQSFILPFVIPPRKADEYVQDRQVLTLGARRVEVIHTPGHAPGHVCYHFADDRVLVGGDLIIMGAVGRTDLPDANEEKLFESIRRVMQLPPETRLLPGHGQPTTLEEERQSNPYVRLALG